MIGNIGFDHSWVQTKFKIAGDYVVKNGGRRFRNSSGFDNKVNGTISDNRVNIIVCARQPPDRT